MKGFCFFLNNEYFTVDVDLVQKVMRKINITPVPSASDEVIGITNLKGRVVTILNLCVLLGSNKKNYVEYGHSTIKAVVLKTFSGNEDQLGLLIDKPGSLVEIDDKNIRSPSLPAGAKESFCICGIAEVDNMLYRIINVDSIINKYKYNGGNENVESV